MINYLQDLSKEVNILGEYPSIVNHNNKAVRSEFGHWFDERNNEYIRNMNSPNGYAKAHWGEFVNLKCKSLSIIDTSITFSADYFNELFSELSSHNTLGNRFFYQMKDTLESEGFASQTDYYTHDDMTIMSNCSQEYKESHQAHFNTSNQMVSGFSLRTELNAIEADVSLLMRNLTVKDVSGNNAADRKYDGSESTDASTSSSSEDASVYGEGLFGSYSDLMKTRSLSAEGSSELPMVQGGLDEDFVNVQMYGEIEESLSYPEELYKAPASVIKERIEDKRDYKDIRDKKTEYKYVTVEEDAKYVKLDNSGIYVLRTDNVKPGQVLGVLMRVTSEKTKPVRILLNEKEVLTVQYRDLRLTRIWLICRHGADEKSNGTWDVYNYSGKCSIVANE